MRQILPKRKTKEPEADRRLPLSFKEKKNLLSGAVRCQSIMEALKNQLTSAHFGDGDRGLGLIWAVALEHYQEFKTLPSEDELEAAVENAIGEDGTYTEEETQVTDRTISQLFRFGDEMFSDQGRHRYVLRLAKKLMQERVAEKAVSAMNSYDDVPVNISLTLRELQEESQRIDSLSVQGVGEAFPEGWQPKSIGKRSTQLVFLDQFLNGGHAAGEIHFAGGPYGSCKTTIGVQLGVECAQEFAREWIASGRKGKLPIWAHFTVEEPTEMVRMRGLACTSLVDRTLLEDIENWQNFSTSDNLKDYERKRYAEMLRRGRRVPGEKERVQNSIKILNRNWKLFDFTGADENLADASTHGVDGMNSVLDTFLRNNDWACMGGITLDYAGALARRNLIAHAGGDLSNMRHTLSVIALQLKDMAQRFHCPIWCFHQLSGAANSRSRKGLPDHTDAAENKAFGENFDFCFVNTVVNDNGMCVMACTKARRAQLIRETVIKVDGPHSRVLSMDGKFVYDRLSKRIIDKRTYDSAVGVDDAIPSPADDDDRDEASRMARNLKSGVV